MDRDGSVQTRDNDVASNIGATDMINATAPSAMPYLPNIPEDYIEIQGVSEVRNAIVELVCENQMRRPSHNKQRNIASMNNPIDIPFEVYHPE